MIPQTQVFHKILKVNALDERSSCFLTHALEAETELRLPKRARQTGDESPIDEESAAGHLNLQGGGRTRYVGAYHWACICDEVAIPFT